jgi:hypothetical protein
MALIEKFQIFFMFLCKLYDTFLSVTASPCHIITAPKISACRGTFVAIILLKKLDLVHLT